VFDIFLTLDGQGHGVMLFEVNQSLYVVSFRETICVTFSMLEDSASKIIGHANIQSAARFAGKNVDPRSHALMMDCRVKPGNDEEKP